MEGAGARGPGGRAGRRALRGMRWVRGVPQGVGVGSLGETDLQGRGPGDCSAGPDRLGSSGDFWGLGPGLLGFGEAAADPIFPW